MKNKCFCMSLSPFVSFQSRFVTYLLTFSHSIVLVQHNAKDPIKFAFTMLSSSNIKAFTWHRCKQGCRVRYFNPTFG